MDKVLEAFSSFSSIDNIRLPNDLRQRSAHVGGFHSEHRIAFLGLNSRGSDFPFFSLLPDQYMSTLCEKVKTLPYVT